MVAGSSSPSLALAGGAVELPALPEPPDAHESGAILAGVSNLPKDLQESESG